MDAVLRDRTNSSDLFAPARLTPAEKRQVNQALEPIGRRMCEICDQEGDLDDFPKYKSRGKSHYRYQCYHCRSTLRARQMKKRYQDDSDYRKSRVQAAQDYRDSLTNKDHYRREGSRRSTLSRKRKREQ